jgi:hypothetical protein
MTLIYGTTNPAKLQWMGHRLEPLGLEIKSLRDFPVLWPSVGESWGQKISFDMLSGFEPQE